jgi:hypothetical protein
MVEKLPRKRNIVLTNWSSELMKAGADGIQFFDIDESWSRQHLVQE